MRPYQTLDSRGQIRRLRRLAETALAAYPLQVKRLTPLAHVENTLFRVDTVAGDQLVLRIHRVTGSPFYPVRSVAEVRSEAAWLTSLRHDSHLNVPEPLLTIDDDVITVAEARGVSESRVCVLFRWQEGRFFDLGLTPSHLERVGVFIAQLHGHARAFAPPPDFIRWRVADFPERLARSAAEVIGVVRGPAAVELVMTVLDRAARVRAELGEGPDVFGLIHADLHQENYLFQRGKVCAIDFDDFGWGHFAYDLCVVLSELRWRDDFADLRAALLRGYRAVRSFPNDHERALDDFHGLRTLLLILWFFEQRDHPSFFDWEDEVDNGLDELARFTQSAR